jgi:predicted ATPase
MTEWKLFKVFQQAMDEGLILSTAHDDTEDFHSDFYKFAHDKVKEATYDLVPESGPERDNLLLPIAIVLIQWASRRPKSKPGEAALPMDGENSTSLRASFIVNENNSIPSSIQDSSIQSLTSAKANKDWMWYVAVQHLNSINMEKFLGSAAPPWEVSSSVLPAIKLDRLRLAKWNYKVAEISHRKGSYQMAIEFLRAAIKYLNEQAMWDPKGKYYQLSLRLYNKLMEIEFSLGNHLKTKGAIAVILRYAANLQDKVTAYHTQVQIAIESSHNDFERGITESLSILQRYGIKISPAPSTIEIGLEKMQLKMALASRSLSTLASCKLIVGNESDSGDIMKLLAQLLHLCSLSKKTALTEIVAIRAMRWTLENGLSRYLALVLTSYSAPLRSQGNYATAGRYGAIVKRIFHRFATENRQNINDIRTSDFLMSEFIVSWIHMDGRPCSHWNCHPNISRIFPSPLVTRRFTSLGKPRIL